MISGSLRERSTNTALLLTAASSAPAGRECRLYRGQATLAAFNPDLEGDLPESVSQLRAEVHAADALLFSTPEYAGALPGPFKNLLDWLIGDADPRSIYNKPAAWLNASPRGAVDAHAELRRVLSYAHALLVEPACVNLPITQDMVNDGKIMRTDVTDAVTRAVEALALAAERMPEVEGTE
jgi:NAD(P)H-dependent FMN reductase